MNFYKLENKIPVPCDSKDMTMNIENRRVALNNNFLISVSTVFLGIDHSWLMEGPPILFETMVFSRFKVFRNDFQERYSTWEEAEIGHKEVVKKFMSWKYYLKCLFGFKK